MALAIRRLPASTDNEICTFTGIPSLFKKDCSAEKIEAFSNGLHQLPPQTFFLGALVVGGVPDGRGKSDGTLFFLSEETPRVSDK